MAKPKMQTDYVKDNDLIQEVTFVDRRMSLVLEMLIENGILKEGKHDASLQERIKDIVALVDFENLS